MNKYYTYSVSIPCVSGAIILDAKLEVHAGSEKQANAKISLWLQGDVIPDIFVQGGNQTVDQTFKKGLWVVDWITLSDVDYCLKKED